MEPIRAVIWGLGTMGSLMAKILSEKEGIEITGAVDLNPNKTGKSLGAITGSSRHGEITVTADAGEALAQEADLVLLATSSFISETAEPVRQIVKSGKNVITIAEEWAFPRRTAPKVAEEIDRLAKTFGVTVLGTGVNPGFVLDTLIISLPELCGGKQNNRQAGERPFTLRPDSNGKPGNRPLARRIRERTRKRRHLRPHRLRTINTHDRLFLGIRLERITQSLEPIIIPYFTKDPLREHLPRAGRWLQSPGRGMVGRQARHHSRTSQQVHPETENVETGDFIHIEGRPDIRLAIQPEIPGGTATAALAST